VCFGRIHRFVNETASGVRSWVLDDVGPRKMSCGSRSFRIDFYRHEFMHGCTTSALGTHTIKGKKFDADTGPDKDQVEVPELDTIDRSSEFINAIPPFSSFA
jgi:hypothetical protein